MNIINSLTSTAKYFIIVTFAIVLSFFSPAKNIQTNKISTGIKPNTAIVTPIPTINISQSMADSKQILVDLEKALSVTASITDKWSSINWLVENKEILPLVGQGFILGVNETSVVGKYGNYSLSTNIRDITEDALKPLQNAVKEFFLSNGFQKDDLNTFRSSEFSVTLFMGYTKGDLKCLVTLFSQSSLFGNFFCGIVDQTRLAWRKELTSAINTTNDLNIVVSVNKIVGNYAQGFVSSPTGLNGGAGWYAVKINDQWKKVWSGHQLTLASCKTLQQYNFPKEIIDLEHSDVCSKSTSQTTQTPIPALETQNKIELKFTCDNISGSYYCDPEIVPTIQPLFSCNCVPLPKPSCSNEGSEMEKVSCKIKESQYKVELMRQCPILRGPILYYRQIESISKHCIRKVSTTKNDVITSTTYTPIYPCYTPTSKDKPNINFNEEVTFDASCTQENASNSVIRYYWQFRDGDLNNFITVDGKVVKHKFTKFAKTFAGGCGGDPWIVGSSGRGFEVSLCIDTKFGKAPCITHHYCPTVNDSVIVNLNNCMKNSNGQKNIDQCISELNL